MTALPFSKRAPCVRTLTIRCAPQRQHIVSSSRAQGLAPMRRELWDAARAKHAEQRPGDHDSVASLAAEQEMALKHPLLHALATLVALGRVCAGLARADYYNVNNVPACDCFFAEPIDRTHCDHCPHHLPAPAARGADAGGAGRDRPSDVGDTIREVDVAASPGPNVAAAFVRAVAAQVERAMPAAIEFARARSKAELDDFWSLATHFAPAMHSRAGAIVTMLQSGNIFDDGVSLGPEMLLLLARCGAVLASALFGNLFSLA